MPTQVDLNNSTASNLANIMDAYEVASLNTDGVMDSEYTDYQNTRASIQWGYFNSIPDLKTAILMKALFNVGKGYTTDAYTEAILDHIYGYGKDSFEDVLFNLEVTKRIYGDAYAEIIKDKKTGILLNLKPLDNASIKIRRDRSGMITKYIQTSKTPGKPEVHFKPEEILHLSNNKLADQVHGLSDIDCLEDTIKADEQSFQDLKKVMRNQARPMIMFKLGTDNAADIAAFANKMDTALGKGENVYIPDDKNAVDFEVVQVNPSSMLLDWRAETRNRFFRAIGLPQIVPGAGGASTESESKVIYLAFEQIVEKSQREVEQQLWNQLQIRIDLVPPISMAPSLATDTAKDGMAQQLTMQASDMQAGVGR